MCKPFFRLGANKIYSFNTLNLVIRVRAVGLVADQVRGRQRSYLWLENHDERLIALHRWLRM
jgi:hypothetical protein